MDNVDNWNSKTSSICITSQYKPVIVLKLIFKTCSKSNLQRFVVKEYGEEFVTK